MYIGSKKIKKIKGTIVSFQDGTEKNYTSKQLSYLVTKKAKDLSEYRALMLDNILPEIREAYLIEDLMEAAKKALYIIEDHDITNAELSNIFERIPSDHITQHNAILKEKVWDIIEKYEKDKEKYQKISEIVNDSYTIWFFTAMGKGFWTYEDGRPPQAFTDNIRVSDIKRLMGK